MRNAVRAEIACLVSTPAVTAKRSIRWAGESAGSQARVILEHRAVAIEHARSGDEIEPAPLRAKMAKRGSARADTRTRRRAPGPVGDDR